MQALPGYLRPLPPVECKLVFAHATRLPGKLRRIRRGPESGAGLAMVVLLLVGMIWAVDLAGVRSAALCAILAR